jgi:WhiB family redox-sensing transcriptional regulator
MPYHPNGAEGEGTDAVPSPDSPEEEVMTDIDETRALLESPDAFGPLGRRPAHGEAAYAGCRDEGAWRSAAACRFADPDLFFPISGSGSALAQIAQAKAVCAGCPVQRQCRAFALRSGERYGIWGGMTEHERYQLRRQDERGTRAGAGASGPPRLHGDHQAAPGGLAG